MTSARATACVAALAVSLWPAVVQPPRADAVAAPGPLWLAPEGKIPASADAFAKAVAQFDDNKPAAALPVFARSVSDPLVGGYALLMVGRAQLALHKTTEARFSATQLAKVEPKDFLRLEAFVLSADVAEAEGDAAAEVSALQSAAELKPTTPAALYLRLGRAAKQAGDMATARGAFEKVIYETALAPEASDALAELEAMTAASGAVPTRDRVKGDLGRGEQLLAAKRYADARKAFDAAQAVAVGGERDLVALRQAQCDIGLKKYTDARRALTPLTVNGTRQWEARQALLAVLRGEGKKDEFVDATRQFVAAAATEGAAAPQASVLAEASLNELATFYILEDRDADAASVFADMWRTYPSGANGERAAWRWGWWSYINGDYAETIRVFDDAFVRFGRSDYRSAWSYWSARAKEKSGQSERALAAYRNVIALYKNSYYGREAQKSLAELAAPKGRASGTAPALTPGAPPANAPLITRLLEIGLYDEAIGELRRIEAAQGTSPLVTATLAYAWNKKGELRTGITLMKRAYPQFIADGGEHLPVAIRRVMFPMAYWELIQKYAKERALDPYLMAALINQESTFDAGIKSAANAWGLMQILPSTGKSYAAKLGIKRWSVTKLTTPEINIRIGMAYYADLAKRYDGNIGALVAYNAGGSRYRRWTQEYPGAGPDEFIDNIPFFETQNYLKRILGTADDFRALYPRTVR